MFSESGGRGPNRHFNCETQSWNELIKLAEWLVSNTQAAELNYERSNKKVFIRNLHWTHCKQRKRSKIPGQLRINGTFRAFEGLTNIAKTIYSSTKRFLCGNYKLMGKLYGAKLGVVPCSPRKKIAWTGHGMKNNLTAIFHRPKKAVVRGNNRNSRQKWFGFGMGVRSSHFLIPTTHFPLPCRKWHSPQTMASATNCSQNIDQGQSSSKRSRVNNESQVFIQRGVISRGSLPADGWQKMQSCSGTEDCLLKACVFGNEVRVPLPFALSHPPPFPLSLSTLLKTHNNCSGQLEWSF